MLQKSSIAEPTIRESMLNNVVQNEPKYYVDMLIVSTIINLKYVFLTKKYG
jgi:tRNA isopentenyl-2-thiomethyl-A-37 hydroxylase MiaE